MVPAGFSRLVFVLVSGVAFLVGIDATSDAACDGRRVDKWDEVLAIALVLGIATAAVTAWFTWRSTSRAAEKGRRA